MRADARHPQLLLDSEPQVSRARRKVAMCECQEGACIAGCSHAVVDLPCRKYNPPCSVVDRLFIPADVDNLYRAHPPSPFSVQVKDPEFVPARQTTKLVPRIESV